MIAMKLYYKCKGKGYFDAYGLLDNHEIESKISIEMLKRESKNRKKGDFVYYEGQKLE